MKKNCITIFLLFTLCFTTFAMADGPVAHTHHQTHSFPPGWVPPTPTNNGEACVGPFDNMATDTQWVCLSSQKDRSCCNCVLARSPYGRVEQVPTQDCNKP